MATALDTRGPFLLAAILLCSGLANAQPYGAVRINEFMASNTTTLLDADGDPSDWIEIYNPGPGPVDLTGWHLTDNEINPFMWTFPPTTLSAGGYLVVFASDKDTVLAGGELHTNFKLNVNGEYFALTRPNGSIATLWSPEYPDQLTNISYGYVAKPASVTSRGGGASAIGGALGDSLIEKYFDTPTPGALNVGGIGGTLDKPQFSVPRGHYDTPFSLTLTAEIPGTLIRYTLDGSSPAGRGSPYSGPITIDTTTVVRAIAERPGWISSKVGTHTYLFVDDVVMQPTIIPGWPNPVYDVGDGSDSVVHDWQMDPAVVNNPAYTADLLASLSSTPTLSLAMDPGDVFGPGGFYDNDDIEIPLSVEVLYGDDPLANHQSDGGVEGHSHVRLKRSLRLNFKASIGDADFDTDLFQRAPLNGLTAANDFDRLILRGGNNRSWARNWNPDKTTFVIDEFFRSSQLAVSGFGSRGQFVHLYIDGLYWGLYNIVERPDAKFTAEYFGGDDEDWFAVNHGGPLSGDSTRYDYLTQTLAFMNMTVPANYAQLQEYLDVEAFCDYLLVQWYTASDDWPLNNWYGGNRSDAAPLGPTLFRYFAWDGEWSLDAPLGSNPSGQAQVHPSFVSALNGGTSPIVKLWHKARKNADFMTLFADRVYTHMFNGGGLSSASASARWTTLTEWVRDAAVAESARWGDSMQSLGDPLRTRNVHWQNEIDVIAGLLQDNDAVMIAALRDEGYYPDIDPPLFSQYGGQVAPGFLVTMSNTNGTGTIYYTLDGTDPRLPGGGIGGTAFAYGGPFSITLSTDIRARVRDGTDWSALAQPVFTMVNTLPLSITEIMYNPSNPTPEEIAQGFTDSDDFEYLEIANAGSTPIDLTGIVLADAIDFTFGPIVLQPFTTLVVVEDTAAFAARYGTAGILVAGQYAGKLANGGELVSLKDAFLQPIESFTFDDVAPWPTEPDGNGPSLQRVSPVLDPTDAASWQASSVDGGTPGGG